MNEKKRYPNRSKGGKATQEKHQQNQWTKEQAKINSRKAWDKMTPEEKSLKARHAIEQRWRKHRMTIDIEKVLEAFREVLETFEVDHEMVLTSSEDDVYVQQLKEKLEAIA